MFGWYTETKLDVPENSPVTGWTEIKTIYTHPICTITVTVQTIYQYSNTELRYLLSRQHAYHVKVRQSCDGKISLICRSNSRWRWSHFYFCVLCVKSLFWELSTNDANATRTSLCVRGGKQAKQTQFQANADMSAAHTTHHNNIDRDGKKRVAYREFGVHLSLTTVTEKAVRWYSRSLRHLPAEQLQHWRRSSAHWRRRSASQHAPRHRGTAGQIPAPTCGSVPVLWTESCVFLLAGLLLNAAVSV